jgi:protein phosphatase 1B
VQKNRLKSGSDPYIDTLSSSLNDLSLREEATVQPPLEDQLLVTALSTDHKPNLPNELQRITKAGYEVVPDRFQSDNDDGNDALIWKIKKSDKDKIAVSRAFGDFDYKENKELDVGEQAVICNPDITVHKRLAGVDQFLVLACDGVYDVMENSDIGLFVVNNAVAPVLLPQVADLLLKNCLERGSRDNMSVMIVELNARALIDDSSSAIGPKALSFIAEE